MDKGVLLWVDIETSRLHSITSNGTHHKSWHFADGITSISLTHSGHYLCTSEKGFFLLDEQFAWLCRSAWLETGLPQNRFNDAKPDPTGRLWAGTMNRDLLHPTGNLYCLDGDLEWRIHDSGYIVSNGPAFLRDGRVLLHTDSVRRVIYQFAMDKDGALHDKREFARLDEAEGLPDGMTTDAEDCIWVCSYYGSRITRFSPRGERILTVELPVSNITSCTFGGDNFRRLFITTATSGLSAQQLELEPLAGSIFCMDCDVPGLPPNRFRLNTNAIANWSSHELD